MLKHILVFTNLYCSKAYFLKRPFFKIYIFTRIGQLFRETAIIKMLVTYKEIFLKNTFIEKIALCLCISFIDLSIHRNIEQTPSEWVSRAIATEHIYFNHQWIRRKHKTIIKLLMQCVWIGRHLGKSSLDWWFSSCLSCPLWPKNSN